MTEAWNDIIGGDRLAVDQEFEQRVRSAGLSSQEWGLVMTAVEFQIEGAEDPETARLVADTSKLGSVLPAMRRSREQAGGVPDADDEGSEEGLLGSVRRALGLGGDERRETAEELAEEYAERLQERLQERGRWRTVCSMAAE